MKNEKKVRTLALIASLLALAMGCVYPTVFIKWIVPLYAVCVAVLAIAAFLLFDALEYDECFCRYRRSAEHLGITADPPDRVLMKLMKDGFVCAGAEPERPDALFSMFCSGFITRAVEQHDAIRPEKRCTYYYDRFLHWEGAEHSDCRQEPLTGDEKIILEMLAAENWTAAELARNFEKGYDASMPRYRVPRERYAILSMDPDADLVRMNYERHPSARQIAAILLNLLRSRKILLY